MTYKITLNGVKYDASIKLGIYSQGRLAIQLIDSDGLPITKASVNLPDNECEIGHCYIKDYAENEGLLQQLIKHGIVSRPIRFAKMSFNMAAYVKYLL